MDVQVNRLCIYPIKSLPGLDVEIMHFDDLGAEHDRRYMLVDDKGCFITQRTSAQLCLINIRAVKGGWMIKLPEQYSTSEQFLPYTGEQEQAVDVEVWSDMVTAFDQGENWAAFFSGYLQQSIRLVYLPVCSLRRIDQEFCDSERYVGFADGFPLLLTTQASLEAIDAALEFNVDIVRFRPNIHVSGAEAFAERCWQSLSVKGAEAEYSIVKPCSRCVIPTIDPETAVKQAAVWKVLKSLCGDDEGNIYFGQNMIHINNSALRIGQSLMVSKV